MGIFNRSNKAKDRLLGAKLSDTRYDSLQELLLGEVSINSGDSKVVTVDFSETRQFRLWISSEKVLAITESSNPVELKHFLYWLNLPEESRVALLGQSSTLSPETLTAAASVAPEALDILKLHLEAYTVESLVSLVNEFPSYKTVDTEIFRLASEATSLLHSAVPLNDIDAKVAAHLQSLDNLVRLIGVSGIPRDEVRLKLQESGYRGASAEERIVLSVAQARLSLQELLDSSAGFSSVKLLETLKSLAERDIIDVSIESSDVLELPELTEFPTRPYEKVFTRTQFGRPMAILVSEVFERSAWKTTVTALAADNRALEDRVGEIEDKLVKELAGESFGTFDELPGDVQATVQLLLSERTTHNAKRVSILKELESNILVRDFELEQELLNVIAAKLAGIEGAVTKFEAIDYSQDSHDFELDGKEIVFSFEDAVIDTNEDGDSYLRVATSDDLVEEPSGEHLLFDNGFEEAAEDFELPESLEPVFDTKQPRILSRIEEARLGVQAVPGVKPSVTPIFLAAAEAMGIDPESLLKD